ncbi:V-set and immunoglobulin domain-containing protein 1-like [Cheilinus undulatus]|uniref:V-set and immunoglobulin domain-containing protein 1-like n=1 Tax=Cheilinus undulatus TaxID=241271 RepID=UPI001BD1CB8C|nr:V-set and immunoglobulin domain-containing protein 1-like [Cheilinus undulatus]
MYHCFGSDNSVIEILATITVSVKGSGVSVPALVHQSESETIQPGGSVTLNCTDKCGTYDCAVVSCGDGTKLDSGELTALLWKFHILNTFETKGCMFQSLNVIFFIFILISAQTAALKSSSVHHERRETGESLTLKCEIKDNGSWIYWFKQTLGEKLRPVCSFNKHGAQSSLFGEFKDNPRFTLDTGNSNLMISDLKMSDSAIYHCICYHYPKLETLETITVSVKGSGVSVPALVHQSESETIQPGGSVTLNCTVHTGTCDGEHSVYWFRNSEEAHPGLIYTHGGRNDQCERNPHSHTHTCVYNLAMRSLNLSHAGTYYCAVVSCGHILFGDGTKLDFGDEVSSGVLVYSLSGALISAVILIVVLAFLLYKMNKRICFLSQEIQARFSAPSTTNMEVNRGADDVCYAAVNVNMPNTSRRQRNTARDECVYSSVRQ